jgi:hypothetical protein
MTYRGFKITTKKVKRDDFYMLEVHFWKQGIFHGTIPCLFELKQDAINGAQGYIDEMLK